MADQASIFESDKTPVTTEANTAPKGDTLPESVALLVGEGRKYRTLEDLAKAYVKADGFIEQLKGENATLRDELKGSKTIEEVLKRLEGTKASGAQDQSDQTIPKGLTAEQVAQIVELQITGRETAQSRRANLLKADSLMKAAFGDKAAEVFQKEATTPDMKKVLVDLASVNPEKFVLMFGATAHKSTSSDNTNSVNSEALSITNNSGRVVDPSCKEFYDELRRKEPARYYSQAVQLQMNKAATVDREKFFGK